MHRTHAPLFRLASTITLASTLALLGAPAHAAERVAAVAPAAPKASLKPVRAELPPRKGEAKPAPAQRPAQPAPSSDESVDLSLG